MLIVGASGVILKFIQYFKEISLSKEHIHSAASHPGYTVCLCPTNKTARLK